MTIRGRLSAASFQKVVLALPVAATLHNVEEWIWLPMEALPESLPVPVGAFEFRLALVVVTSIYWIAALRATRAPPHHPWVYAALASGAILTLNVVFPHLLATVLLGVYAPGVVTAVLLNTWIPLLVIMAAVREGYASYPGTARATLLACAVVPAALAAVFFLARLLSGGFFGG